MYGNLKQKISNELSARVIKIVNDLDTQNNIPEIEKRPLCDQIFTELNDKLTAKLTHVFPMLILLSLRNLVEFMPN